MWASTYMTTSQLGFLDAFATFPLPGIARCTLLRGIQGPLQVPNAVSREFPPPMSLASEVFYQLSLSHPQSSGSHQCPFFNHKSHWSTVLFYYCFRFFWGGGGDSWLHAWYVCVAYMHLCMQVHMFRPDRNIWCPTRSSWPYSFETVSLIEYGARLAISKPRIHVSSLSAMMVQVHNVVIACLLLSARNLNLVLHVCTASPHSTELPLKPVK